MHHTLIKEDKKFDIYALLEFDEGDRFVPCQMVLDVEEGYVWTSLENGGIVTDVPIAMHSLLFKEAQ